MMELCRVDLAWEILLQFLTKEFLYGMSSLEQGLLV